ncbi:unnamed protein product [Absidia cylindrospora]
MSLLIENKERLLEGIETPDFLGADDFIDIFDNMAHFEKELGIDGEVNSSNVQSIGMKNEELDTWSHHVQGNADWKTLDPSIYETGSPQVPPSRASSSYRHHSPQPTSLAAANETCFSSHDISRTCSNSSRTHNYELEIQRITAQVERKRNRLQTLRDMINERRQQFQQQKRVDAEHVPQQLSRIQEHARANEKHWMDKQAWKRQKHSELSEALGLALSDTITAATTIGIPQLESSQITSSHHEETQLNFQEPPPTGVIDEASNTNELDPEDPDPWDEEMEHYLLIGRIKRLEDLRAIHEAETTGKEYTATLYNPTGIRRHEYNPLLSRYGAGLSVAGAAKHAVSSNARIPPSGNQGSSSVLQTGNQYSTHTQHLDKQQQQQQQSYKRRRLSETFASNGNNNDILEYGTTIGGTIPNCMDLSTPSPSPTRAKSSILMISNLCTSVGEARLKSLAPKGLKSLYLNRSDNTATLYFLSIDAAVMFRRKYDRSLLGGQHVTIDFIKD